MTIRLLITGDQYRLAQQDGEVSSPIATLQHGADALLSPKHALGEASLEAAIERAEDWLMPHARRLHGELLEVEDRTGRLASGLKDILAVTASEWTVEQLEQHFLALVKLTTGRRPVAGGQPGHGFVADVLLLRELAHHGQVRAIHLAGSGHFSVE